MELNRRRYLATATATITTLALAGCSGDTDYEEGSNGDDGSDSDKNGDDGSDSDKKLEILDNEMVREDEGSMAESVKVVGTAKNVSGDNLGYAEVKAKFYDEDDTLLDSFLDNVNDLGAGEKWKFEVMYLSMGEDAQEVASYKVGVGSNF